MTKKTKKENLCICCDEKPAINTLISELIPETVEDTGFDFPILECIECFYLHCVESYYYLLANTVIEEELTPLLEDNTNPDWGDHQYDITEISKKIKQ